MRLFVAVNLPPAERRAAHKAAAPLRSAGLPVRWVAEDALHITMKFLGEVDHALAGPIGEALTVAVADVRPFELALGGFGVFPEMARPRVLWFGVEHHPALELLANDVEKALGPFGFAPELKPFQPHLTLGRARKESRPADFRGLAAMAEHIAFDAVIPVGSVDLMESILGPSGPTYRVAQRAPLGKER